MGLDAINGRDVFDDCEEFGDRYHSVAPPERRRHRESGGESAGEGSEANSPQPQGRLPLFEENDDSLFGFSKAPLGSEPREEAREMLLELHGRAATLEELDAEDEPAVRAEPAQPSLEQLYRQVRTILDMASRVEQQLKALLDAEGGSWQLPPRGASCQLAPAASHRSGQRPPQDEQATTEEDVSKPAQDAPITTHPSPLTRRSRGRGPSKMTPARKAEVVHYVRAGLSLRQAASFVGCHHTTITKAAQRDEEFARKLQRAEQMGDALPLVRVIRASRQSWRAAAWLVKNHQPSAALRCERAAERDAEAAESIVRLDRLIRRQAPDVDVKAVLRGGSVSIELRPRGERSGATGT